MPGSTRSIGSPSPPRSPRSPGYPHSPDPRPSLPRLPKLARYPGSPHFPGSPALDSQGHQALPSRPKLPFLLRLLSPPPCRYSNSPGSADRVESLESLKYVGKNSLLVTPHSNPTKRNFYFQKNETALKLIWGIDFIKNSCREAIVLKVRCKVYVQIC